MTRRVLCFSFFRSCVVAGQKSCFCVFVNKKNDAKRREKKGKKGREKREGNKSISLLSSSSTRSLARPQFSRCSRIFFRSLSLSRARLAAFFLSLSVCLSLFLLRAFHHTHASHVCFLKKKRSRFFKGKKIGQNDPRTFCLSESSIEREEEDSTRAVSRVSFFFPRRRRRRRRR